MTGEPTRPMGGRAEARLAQRGGIVELLRVPAALFTALIRLRGALYDRGLLPVLRLDTPVVSVGNLSVGGTGKTPMCAWIARRLAARGWRPGVLSRGYGRRPGESSDEARLLERLLPDVPQVQDPDRVSGGRALQERGVDAIVMDDGFQHRRLYRDLDLVLVDATRPWGLPAPRAGGPPVRALLPRGFLREGPAALARAQALVITRSDGTDPATLAGLRAELGDLAPGRPIALARHTPTALASLEEDGEGEGGREGRRRLPRDLAELDGLEVDLVSAIGNPEAFETTARGLGARVVQHRIFPDHHPYGPRDLEGLGPRPVLTTAKDGIKLAAAAPGRGGREGPGAPTLLVLDVTLEIVEGGDVLEDLLDALPEAARTRERRALHGGLHG